MKQRACCRSIQKQDWEPLLSFLEEKKVRVSNLEQARQGPGVAQQLPGLDEVLGGDDEEEEDDDFGGVSSFELQLPAGQPVTLC